MKNPLFLITIIIKMKLKLICSLFLMLLSFNYASSQAASEIDPDKITIGSTVTIDGEGAEKGGQMTLRDSTGNDRLILFALPDTSDKAGSIEFYNSKNLKRLFISAASGGKINFVDTLGSITSKIRRLKIELGETVEINARSIADGGDIILRDVDGNLRVRLLSQLNTTNNTGGVVKLFNGINEETVFINGNDNRNGAKIVLRDSLGSDRLTFNTDHNGTGDSRIITDEIAIKGGSDLAELFDITDTKELTKAGMLVSLDPNHPGKLMISQKAYDRKIVGVISGANGVKPGILMGQENTLAHGDELVTLSGRTYVKCNTSNGSIKVGDFITSSDIAGEGMRVTKVRKSRGAVIGKAMTTLEQGEGFILVLINLQ